MMKGERKKTVLAVPDLHLPWVDWKKVNRLYDFVKEEKIDVIIQLGDLYDQFSYSKFARSHDLMTPHEEISEAREGAVNFWKTMRRLKPKSELIQLTGNHDIRLLSRAAERYPEIASFLSKISTDLYTFPNVKTIYDARDGVKIEDVLYIHGYLTQLGAHMKHFGCNVVHGHTHRAGSLFLNFMGQTLWELDCGFLADRKEAPLMYGQTKHMNWVEGFGVVDPGGPRFITL
jgi:predicted phosphodiesterase